MRFGGKWVRITLPLVFLLLAGSAGHRLVQERSRRAHYRAAEAALERRDFRQASAHLKKCLEVEPNDLSVRLLAARTARRQGDYDEVLEQLRACEQTDGPRDIVQLERRLIRMQRGDIDAGVLLAPWLERPEEPETPWVLEALIAGSLTILEPAHARGVTFGFETDKGAPYLALVRKAVALWLQLRPGPADQVQGLVWRGRLHEIASEHTKALTDLRKALELDADHFGARLHLAICLVQEAPEETVSHLEMLRQREPGHKHARFALANARRLLGQPEKARPLYHDLLADYPDDVPVLIERGIVELDAQRAEAAEPWLRRALALAPHDPEVNLALSRCLRGLARPAEANHYQTRFLQIEAARKRQQHEQPQK